VKIKNQQDFFSGLMFVVVGLLFAYGATDYKMGPPSNPGPGYFPMALSLIMAALGAIVIFTSLTIETEDGGKIGKIAWRPLIVIVAAITLFAFCLPRLGLFITVPLLIVLVSMAGNEFSWVSVLVTCAVLTVFAWFVFVYGLKLIIPLWPVALTG
jgi:Tripartite tricarboxylate transporter TctB family